MRKLRVVMTAVCAAALLAAAPAASGQPPGTELSGGVKISVHTHSADPGFPGRTGLLVATDRLSFDFAEGEDFTYSSRVCGGPAPFNDVGLDFRPDYPGVDDDDGTAPVRHVVTGTVTEVSGDRGTIEGTIETRLCEQQGGTQVESGDRIFTDFEARYRRVSDNEVQLSGRFEIVGGTGTFADLEGQGSLRAILVCLAAQRDPSQPTCAERGFFTDFVGLRGDVTKPPGETTPGLVGTFRDPTVPSV